MPALEIEHGYTGEEHPEVFTTMPPQPKEKKAGQLPPSMIQHFFHEGYVLVPDFFKKEELAACREATVQKVEDLAQFLYKNGKISRLYQEYGLFQRLTEITKEFPGANVLLLKNDTLPQAFKDLWSNERLLNVIKQLLGPDIVGHPLWNLRTKIPQDEATTVPWHQDSGYLDNTSYKVLQPTAWIPLLDATEEMDVAVRGHAKGKIATHQCCSGGTWYIMLEEDEMRRTLGINPETDFKVCPVPYGGILFINNMIPHRSLNNLSNDIRWSLDLRWQKPGLPVGFYGLKQGVLMRSSTNPDLVIDWDSFDVIDRQEKLRESCKDNGTPPAADDPRFDTTVQGPWLKKWEIVNHNRHTAKPYDAAAWHKIQLL